MTTGCSSRRVEELAAMGPWPLEEVERALKLIQGFDPIGVAARDLQECLLLQLRHLGMSGTPAERIVTEHMRLLQNHQVPELARKLGLSIDDLKQHIELIRHLDPKPGSRLQSRRNRNTSSPTSTSSRSRSSTSRCSTRKGLPQLRISPVYRRLLDKSRSENTRRDARLRQGQVPLGALADQVGRAAAEDHPQGRRRASSTSSAISSITASSTSARSCCATWPTTSACTNPPSAASSRTSTCTRRRACSR